MLYSPNIEPVSRSEDVTLDSIKSFDLSIDGFEVTVEVDPRPKKNQSDEA